MHFLHPNLITIKLIVQYTISRRLVRRIAKLESEADISPYIGKNQCNYSVLNKFYFKIILHYLLHKRHFTLRAI